MKDETFYFTRNERYGTLLFLLLAFLFFTLPYTFPGLFRNAAKPVNQEVVHFFEIQEKKKSKSKWSYTNTTDYTSSRRYKSEATIPISYFEFNPNTVSFQELRQLGLPSKTAATLIKFRKKGFTFKSAEDLLKIYGMRTADFENLAPWVRLPEAAEPERDTATYLPKNKTTQPPITIDINQASAAEWQKLRGIGPYYAKRIVEFREKLGGFSAIDQVAETYHLPDSVFQKIQPFLKGSPVLKKITINTADAATLQAHPYIKWKQANTIVKYRDNHGPYQHADDLKKTGVISDELLIRLKPYLIFQAP